MKTNKGIIDKIKFSTIRDTLLLSSATFLCFLMPGFIFGIYMQNYTIRLEISFLLAFILASILLSAAKPKIISIIIITFIMLLEFMQFSNLFYFGVPLSPFSIDLFFKEQGEVWESALSTFPQSLYHILIVTFCYISLIILYLKFSTQNKTYIATALLIILLALLPYKALYKTPKIANFMPRNDRVSVYNSLMSFSGYAFILAGKNNPSITSYLPYEIEKIENNNPADTNIIIIVGESVNSSHIGLLGYDRNTSPLMDNLALNDKNFIAKEAISSSILTKNSLALFLNSTYEHDNVNHITMQKTHLVKLAKENGFNTFYISNQTEVEAAFFAPNYIDTLKTKEDYFLRSEKIGDLVLLEEIEKHKQDFIKGKNFIIIHQRNPHSPYEKGYKAYKGDIDLFPLSDDVYKYRINSYDNAMIFNDYIIHSLFDFFKNLGPKTYIMFVPDHGEALGENDKWGHAILDFNIAKIPFYASLYNGDDSVYLDILENLHYPTHYEIAHLIANLLGVKIHNPNIKDKNIFYINGVDISGNGGYIKGIKNEDKIETTILN